MRKDNNAGLYIGLLLVLGGIVCFLDLNGLLPSGLFSEYINLIIGIIILVGYVRNRRLSTLMIASFFIFNGGILILDRFLYGWNYLAGVFLIPGLMLMVAFFARRGLAYLIPGSMLTSWGMFVLLMTAGILRGFSMVVGMGFVFTALAFLMIFMYVKEIWSGIPALILGIIGVVIITLGLGEIARVILFNIVAIVIVLVGLILIARSFIKPKEDSDREEH